MYSEWAERFRVLGDSTRLKILGLLSVRDACVCELVDLLPISQPAVSQHLRRLKQVGFVEEYRQKSWMYYHLRADIPPLIAEWVRTLEVDNQDALWLATHQVGITCTVTQPLSEELVPAGPEQLKEEI